MIEFTSKCEQDTIDFACKLASHLHAKDIIVLTGDLGSGKTKFVQGILKYFGLENNISSPTFTIVNEYNTSSFPIYHFDVYRLADSDEFYAMGGEEYFENGLCLIEWGETIQEVLPANYLKVTFVKDFNNENNRILQIEAFGNKTLEQYGLQSL